MLQAGRSSLRLRLLQAGLFYFATKKNGIGRCAVATTTAVGGTVLLCRHYGSELILDFRPRLANRCSRGAILGRNRAVILDFRPRLANRCSQKAKTGANRASILDFKPRLANRCSQEAKTRANRAVILDFRPRLTNRCSQEVKTGPSLQPKGVRHCAAAEECRMGRDFGRRSRPWLREREGPAAQRREGKHRRCAPVRSPCPQADSDAGTRPLPAGRVGRRAETISCGSAAR